MTWITTAGHRRSGHRCLIGTSRGQNGAIRPAPFYRDVEELLAERGIHVDHVTVYR
ncbi:hypothetical protein FHR83_005560 [Actinoplanes campanulatus]|uniref:Uncharacterized protein n=1 Tax=Actinoplanes campanulatus TaxID=113559 RepID=A0A7W5AKC3_9ACTN|nr:hypothetical protein [Actinoplanes campanulatus]MBB3097876.1 hypothetical protein [Actinoplanes campanulatus]GGN22450.1 hypothetical protein GCM10010109_37050 [Actinoplanes campanulatus]GID34565.1 hypothetical protein Aca09nite_10710 [Actinoplanes campanulatus]